MTIPLGGFMPIPLAMMIPFMATQSMVMGDAFGRAFQYGKRKISAMSNEEFNATSLEQQASEMFASYRNIIPTLEHSIQDSQRLQEKIIKEMLLILPRFAVSEEFAKPVPFTVGGAKTIQELIGNLIPNIPEASAVSGGTSTTQLQQLQQTFAAAQQRGPVQGPSDLRSQRDIQIAKDLATQQRIETQRLSSLTQTSGQKITSDKLYVSFLQQIETQIMNIATAKKNMAYWDKLADGVKAGTVTGNRITFQRFYTQAQKQLQTAKKKLIMLGKNNNRSPNRNIQKRATQLNGEIQQGRWI